MRRCKITIELDREDPSYSPTEPVSGRVIVDVQRETRCNKLELSSVIRTAGRGDVYEDINDPRILFSGHWAPGKYIYPFKKNIKSTQASYLGEFIKVEWYLKATADIPLSKDVSEKIAFTRALETETKFIGKKYDLKNELLGGKDNIEIRRSNISGRLIIFILTLPVLFGLLVMFKGTLPQFLQPLGDFLTSSSYTDELFKHFGLGFWIPFFAALMVVLPRVFGQKSAEKTLGNPEVTVTSGTEVKPGGCLRGLLSFTPTKNAKVYESRAVLRCYEKTVNSSGKRRSTSEHIIYEAPIDIPFFQPLWKGDSVEKEFEIEIPKNAPVSFTLGKNQLVWEVAIELTLGKRNKWTSNTLINLIARNN